MTKLSPIITDIVHTATQAALTDDEQIQRQGLADIYDAIASVLHLDHRAFQSHNHPIAQSPNPPIIPGCPSLGPKVFPFGADGTAPAEDDDKAKRQAEFFRRKYSFCNGLFPIRYANTEDGVMASCWISGRRFTMDLDNNERDDGGHDCAAVIKDNGKVVATIETQRGKSISANVAFAAFKAYVLNLSGSGKLSSRGGFLKQACKRRAEAQALIEKELA